MVNILTHCKLTSVSILYKKLSFDTPASVVLLVVTFSLDGPVNCGSYIEFPCIIKYHPDHDTISYYNLQLFSESEEI